MIRKRRKYGDMDRILEELMEYTKNQLKELSFSYEKLGQTLKKMPACHWALQEEEIINIIGRISMEACENCSRFYQCYRTDKEWIYEEVESLLRKLERQGTGKEITPSEEFLEICLRKEEFVRALMQSYEIIGVHRSWKNKMLYQRKLMASQMEEISRMLFQCSAMVGYDSWNEEGWQRKVKKRLKSEKILIDAIRLYENKAKKKEIFLVARKRGKSCNVDVVSRILENILGIPIVPARDCKTTLYGEKTLLHFKEDVSFHLLSGMAYKIKEGEQVSGDLFSVMKIDQGKQVYLLADGMGSGEKAREEGSRMIDLVEQLLTTGFHEEEAVKLANSTVTFGLERSMYSSVDVLSVNLYTGLMKIIKSASAATFVVRKGKVEVIRSKNLPAGFMWDVEIDVVYKKLYDGDKVVLLSDGVLDCVGSEQPEEILEEVVMEACQGNPQQAAEEILEFAFCHNGNRASDDMTVLVLAAWRKNRR